MAFNPSVESPLDLQRQRIIRVRIEAVSLASTIIKVHPDGTGA